MFYAKSQVVKNINIEISGTLSTLLTTYEKTSITNLIVTGSIDARDVKCMRDELTKLSVLDLSLVVVKAYIGTEGTYSTISTNYPENQMPSSSFQSNGFGKVSLKSVLLPTSIVSIGSLAFGFCSGLTEISFPNSVTNIGWNAFQACTGLSSIYISKFITSIGNRAFWQCISLNDFIVDQNNPNFSSQEGVLFDKNKTILMQCSPQKQGIYTIPNTVKTVVDYAFSDCKYLTNIIIPNTVNQINSFAFYYCTGLTNVNLPNSISKIDKYTFRYCSGIKSINIPNSITSIGDYALSNCYGLTSISIPNSVNTIGTAVFYSSINLNSIYSYANTPVDLSHVNSVFMNVNTQSCILYVPNGSKENYRLANQWSDFKNIIEMTTGLSNKYDSKISIFVNNATKLLDIKGLEGTAVISIAGLNGKIVFKEQIKNNSSLSISNLNKGLYILNVVCDLENYKEKIFIR